MKATARAVLRLLGFFLALALLVALANAVLVRMDAVTAITMHEMKTRSDIELCAVGSSLAQDHFNAALVSEATGKRAFSASVNAASLQSAIAVTQELLRTNRPEWIALVLDTYNLSTAKEDIYAECRLMPHLTGLRAKLDYYLRLCRTDGDYLDRLLLFRPFGVTSLSDVVKNICLRIDPEAAFADAARDMPPDVTYMGCGYLRYTTPAGVEELVRRQLIREPDPDPGYRFPLLPQTREMLSDYFALCEEAGVRLMVVISPALTAHALAEPDFLPYADNLSAFCAEAGVPCFNFTYAKPEFLPHLDDTFFDLHHMNADGADRFSAAFAELFNRFTAGEDVSGLFYATRWEYFASLDFITNVWLKPDGDGFTADCNRGSEVTPLYRFCLLGGGGQETSLGDWSPQAHIGVTLAPGETLRVYAMPQGGAQDERVYFDYPDDDLSAAPDAA